MSNPNPQNPDETQNPNPQNPDETQNLNPQCEEAKKLGSKRRNAQERQLRNKLKDIVKTLKPIPFVPSKALNFETHKALLEHLGLWDFVHIKFDTAIREDLVARLIAIIKDLESEAAPTNFSAVSSTAARRVPKRKKLGSKRRNAQERQLRKKLKVLVETLKPIPFVPSKALNFETHKALLEHLGLWDFVHIEFDTTIRKDLVAQLIASYGQYTRCSYVNGCRINVNRADLARALKLPVKLPMKKIPASAAAVESVESLELIAFIEELVFNWMLLHDDIHVMTDDVLAYLKVIKEGHFEKVDWVGLIWNMLEKELKEEKLVNCYYASYLQQLIKIQHGELLEEAPKVEEEEEAGVKGEGEEVGVKDEEEEEDVGEELDDNGDVKMGGVDESRVHELEENKIELSLGQDHVERVEVEKEPEEVGGDQIMDFEPAKEEEHGTWLLDLKNNVGEPFLRPCHTGDVKVMDYGEMKEDEGEEGQEQDEGEEGQEQEEGEEGQEQEEEEDAEDQHEGGFHLPPKCIPMEGMPSGTGSLIQAMDAGQLTFGSGIDLRDNHIGDFLSSRDDDQLIAGSSLFGNGHKRDIGMDNHNPDHSLNGSNKRLRSDSPWNSKPVDMELCIENMQHWMGKARMLYAAKEEACIESTNNQQVLLNMIDHLHKVKMDDGHKIYRLEKELYMMTSLVEGYRKAFKEAQKVFDEYRACCSQSDEPLYKDVPGSGGLVLSVKEFEKEHLRKEEEKRMKMRDYENKFRDIEGAWFIKLEGHASTVQSLGNRLLAIGDQIKHE